MATQSKLAVILHADVVGSTALVRKDELLAHDRIRAAFEGFADTVRAYKGTVSEVRGDALVAEFARASDAVLAALAAQITNGERNATLTDDVVPEMRVGIALGEVVVADGTVTGGGVVLAQRLEQLAEAGGVCVQGSVYEAVSERLPLDYTNLGEQTVKGFDEPVRAYAVALRPGESLPAPEHLVSWQAKVGRPRRQWVATAGVVLLLVVVGMAAWFQPWKKPPDSSVSSSESTTARPGASETGKPRPQEKDGRAGLPLSDKPSIAVLAFTNMSEDPKQEYFADGIAEDIITDLSKVSGVFVVARNSSFSYKGANVSVKTVANELGVRYVLEGSVRRAGETLRITAQLIDASTEGHLWAERYDGSVRDVFGLQDKITEQIVRALAAKLTPDESLSMQREQTTSVEAHDAYLQVSIIGVRLATMRKPNCVFVEPLNSTPILRRRIRRSQKSICAARLIAREVTPIEGLSASTQLRSLARSDDCSNQ
jgi:adenylate cyclase